MDLGLTWRDHFDADLLISRLGHRASIISFFRSPDPLRHFEILETSPSATESLHRHAAQELHGPDHEDTQFLRSHLERFRREHSTG